MGKPKTNRREREEREGNLRQLSIDVNANMQEHVNEGAASALRILAAHGDQYLGAILTLRTEYERRGWEVS